MAGSWQLWVKMLNLQIAFRFRLYILQSLLILIFIKAVKKCWPVPGSKIVMCSHVKKNAWGPPLTSSDHARLLFACIGLFYFRDVPDYLRAWHRLKQCKPVDVSVLEQVVCTVIRLLHLFYCIFLFSSYIFNLFFLPFFYKGNGG